MQLRVRRLRLKRAARDDLVNGTRGVLLADLPHDTAQISQIELIRLDHTERQHVAVCD
jgi:hypothetical protein